MMVKAVSGNVEYAGELARSGRYEFNSHSGDIRLMLAGGTGFELRRTRSAERSSRISPWIAEARRRPDGRGQAGFSSGRAIRGAFGDASAMLALRAFSGNISITRR